MERSHLLHTIQHLVRALAVVSVPAEAETAVDTGATKAVVTAVPYQLIDFLTLELVLLGGLVLLAFVFIARKPRTR